MDSNAKQEWLESFQGATLVLEPTFGSPKVNHMFQRNFDHLGRNAFFISVRGRIVLGEEAVSMAEKHIYDRMTEIMKALERKIEAAKAVMLDAEITIMANYNQPVTHRAVVVSPMQTQYIKLLTRADELLRYINTLMLHGAMAEREHSKRELEIKQHMRTIPSAVRKVYLGLRNRMSEQATKDGNAKVGDTSEPAANDNLVDTEVANDVAASEVEAPEAIAAAA